MFEALHADRAPEHDWRHWTLDLRDPDSAAVTAFAASRRHEVLFHEFLQWLADRSLAAAQRRAREAGMRIGLIGDLAVGMDPTGSHAWSRQRDILLGAHDRRAARPVQSARPGLGADRFLAPRPGGRRLRAVHRHAARGAAPRRRPAHRPCHGPVAAVAGAGGADPADGAYLAYPLADLLRLLALESARHDAIVVGEDLGTVPAGFRETLSQDGVHGMRVLWFEREDEQLRPAGCLGRRRHWR